MSESIVRKVRKLLALAGDSSASDGEIETAMLHAKRLMDRHHITESDLERKPEDDFRAAEEAAKGMSRAFVGKTIYMWERLLASFVSDFVGCPFYLDGEILMVRKGGFIVHDEHGRIKQGKSVVFFGIAEDAAISCEVYHELRELISTLAYGRFGSIFKGDGGTYSEGFVFGLMERLETVRNLTDKSNDSTALIIQSRTAELIEHKRGVAEQWIQQQGVQLRKQKHTGGAVSGSVQAFNQGKSDGMNAEVDRTRRKKLATS